MVFVLRQRQGAAARQGVAFTEIDMTGDAANEKAMVARAGGS
jgi:hypothetical protein